MRLPNAAQAIVPIEKLRDYCLSAEHPVGKHKARVFRAAFGWTAADAERLQRLLTAAARTQDAAPTTRNAFGQLYEVTSPAAGLFGEVSIVSAWIVLDTEDVARLVTCYVSTERATHDGDD